MDEFDTFFAIKHPRPYNGGLDNFIQSLSDAQVHYIARKLRSERTLVGDHQWLRRIMYFYLRNKPDYDFIGTVLHALKEYYKEYGYG
jgi:hypothetical protein